MSVRYSMEAWVAERDELVELLREIRDLQKAHFERYQEFTAAALQRQQDAAERQKEVVAVNAREREVAAQQREIAAQHRDDVKQGLAALRSARARSGSAVWVSAVLQAVLIVSLWYMILVVL